MLDNVRCDSEAFGVSGRDSFGCGRARKVLHQELDRHHNACTPCSLRVVYYELSTLYSCVTVDLVPRPLKLVRVHAPVQN